MAQLEPTVPEEGWLTEQLAGLREKMHHLRRDHEARLRETNRRTHKLDGSARRHAAELAKDQRELLHLEKRLERLDGAVAEQEKRIRQVTEQATHALGEGDAAALLSHLRTAEQLQRHANKLLKLIARTEGEVVRRMGAIVKRSDEVSPI
jgi:chromosome segregation ATPase